MEYSTRRRKKESCANRFKLVLSTFWKITNRKNMTENKIFYSTFKIEKLLKLIWRNNFYFNTKIINQWTILNKRVVRLNFEDTAIKNLEFKGCTKIFWKFKKNPKLWEFFSKLLRIFFPNFGKNIFKNVNKKNYNVFKK